MLSSAFSSPVRWLAIVSAAIVLAGAPGCGDDDRPPEDAGTEEGGSGGRGGRGSSTGGRGGSTGSGIDPLPANTAGKACDDNGDCGNGTCLQSFPAAIGMGPATPGGYCSGECLSDVDCGDGGACLGAITGLPGVQPIRGNCVEACRETSDCRDGYRCVNGLGIPVGEPPADAGTPDPAMGLLGPNSCQPAPETDRLDDGIVGKACAADGECGDGRCLTMSQTTTYPGGYCTGRCLEDEHCGESGICSGSIAGGAGTCYLSCGSDADCPRDGYRCRAQGQTMRCVPGAAPLPDNTVGNACTADADCGGAAMSCAARLGQFDAPGNYCTQRCVNASDCGAGGVCVGGFGAGVGGGTCYRTCTDATQCRDGYTCGPAGRTGMAAMTNICSVTPPPPDDAGVE